MGQNFYSLEGVLMSFQDDVRENEMIELFDLVKDQTEGRSGVDAFLEIDGKTLAFELKTTSRGSVTTVRDFGLDHIRKWEGKHWLIGFFVGGDIHYKYGSPSMMKPWIDSKHEYILPDYKISGLASSYLGEKDLFEICGEKEIYTFEDAKKLHKRQYSAEKYRSLMDLNNGYSKEVMLDILKDRAKYIALRGSTLNNPHIPSTYFRGWERITENHAAHFRRLVRQYLSTV